MKKHITLLLFLVIVIIILFSCNKEEHYRPKNLIEYFPNKIGYQWQYQSVWENDTGKVVVTIIGDSILGSDTFKVWEYVLFDELYGEFVWDYQFVNSSSNLIITIGPVLPYILIQPFEIGNWWLAPSFYYDSVFVQGIDQIAIGVNVYENVYHLHREFYESPNTFSNDYWIKPEVGLVKFTEYGFFGAPPKFAFGKTWKLIEYNFNQ